MPKWDKDAIFYVIVKTNYPNFYCFDVTLHQTNLEQEMTAKYLDVHPGKISSKNAAPGSACYLFNSNCNSCHYMAMVYHWYLIGQQWPTEAVFYRSARTEQVNQNSVFRTKTEPNRTCKKRIKTYTWIVDLTNKQTKLSQLAVKPRSNKQSNKEF